jgi:hypothetical protein
MTMCSHVGLHRRFGGTHYFHPECWKVRKSASVFCFYYLITRFTYSSALKTEAVLFFGTSVNSYLIRRCHTVWSHINSLHFCDGFLHRLSADVIVRTVIHRSKDTEIIIKLLSAEEKTWMCPNLWRILVITEEATFQERELKKKRPWMQFIGQTDHVCLRRPFCVRPSNDAANYVGCQNLISATSWPFSHFLLSSPKQWRLHSTWRHFQLFRFIVSLNYREQR